MAEIATNFPPQTYSSSFFLNSLTDDEKNAVNKESTSSKRAENNAPLLDCFISTMPRLLQILVAGALLFTQYTSEAIECAIGNEERTRIFNSVKEYQANKYPFDPVVSGWLGSTVEFNISSLSTLEKNIFVTADSQHIIKMNLTGKQIEQVSDGAFLELECLHELLLDRNNIKKLSKHTFLGLHHLQKLDLSRNQLDNLPDFVFINVPRLKMLDLSHNQIGSVQFMTFENLTILELLNLETNKLETLEPEVFKPLTNLKTLNLAWNKLVDIEPEKWQGLERLENLDLAGNGLDHLDSTYNFTFSSLKTLNLSSNSLTELNVLTLKNRLPKLELIDINNNLWICQDLDSMIHDLHDLQIRVVLGKDTSKWEHGIACGLSVPLEKTTGFTMPIPTTPDPFLSNKKYIETVVEKKFKDISEKINLISSLQTEIILLYVIVSVFVVFEIFVRTKWYRITINLFRSSDAIPLDNDNAEQSLGLVDRD